MQTNTRVPSTKWSIIVAISTLATSLHAEQVITKVEAESMKYSGPWVTESFQGFNYAGVKLFGNGDTAASPRWGNSIVRSA